MEDGLSFSGPWIGETIGYDSPAHIWEISVLGDQLRIRSRWEGEVQLTTMGATLVAGEAAFMINKCKAVLIDRQHFVIPGWDTNDVRGSEGPDYDVVFSRPGIAELSAEAAYQQFLELQMRNGRHRSE